jgi:hypothetical protein
MVVLAGVIVLSVVAGTSEATAYAPVEPSVVDDDPPERQIGVVALGDTAEPPAWMVEVDDLFEDRSVDPEIVGDAHLAQRLERHRVPGEQGPLPEALAELPGQIEHGIEQFFVRGNDSAIEALTRVFERGIDHLPALARRPGLAATVYRAGTVLVRAYRNLGRSEGARGVARDLYRHLPGREPSLATATRDDLKFFYVERAHVAKTGAELTIEVVGASDCERYVNGTRVKERTVTVSSEMNHYLAARCDGEWGPVWRLRPRPGEYATVPLSATGPLEYTLRESTYRQRRRAADYLRLIAHWSGVSEVVAVGQPTTATGEGPYLVMRVAPDGSAAWAEVPRRADVDRAMTELLPTLDAEPLVATDTRLPTTLDWRDIALLGGGTTTLLGGTLAGALVETGTLGSTDSRAARPRLHLHRAAYLTTVATGIGLTTWGIVRQLRHDRRDQPELTAQRPRISIQPTPTGASATLQFTW